MLSHVDIRSGVYFDSVSLMQASARVKDLDGVADALIGMGTELNLDLMRSLDFDIDPAVSPNDLVIALRCADAEVLEAAMAELDVALAALRSTGGGLSTGGESPALTVGSAAKRTEANLAVISVPGEHATTEALDAIAAGCSVMLFSDNVPVESEVLLKDAAAAADAIVMGPDCGTAVVSQAALGFANRVPPGRFGIVAASGTGAQQVTTLLSAAGEGVSHVLGTGGRDMSAAVGGRSTKQALRALAADEATEHIIIVSKPADAGVVDEVAALAGELGVGVTWAVLGSGRPDLTAAVEAALRAAGGAAPEWPSWLPETSDQQAGGGDLRGYFCGGTLADEAMLIAGQVLGPVPSNIPLAGAEQLSGGSVPESGSFVIDFGDDEMTAGRAHPMIDPSLRLEALERTGAGAGVVLLDLVLGYGAHAAPVEPLAAAIERVRARAGQEHGHRLPVVVSLVGTEEDPQGLSASVEALTAAGAEVFASNAAATRRALHHLGHDAAPDAAQRPETGAQTGWQTSGQAGDRAGASATAAGGAPLRGLLAADPVVVSAGLSLFAQELQAQAVAVTEVDWRPPLGSAAAVQAVMADPRRADANRKAIERMLAAGAELVAVRPARECLGLADTEFLHAGPPLTWEDASGPMRGALTGAVVFEGLVDTIEEAEEGLASGRFTFAPCHSREAVGPMAGVVSPSMWMMELHDPVHGNRAYCSLNEGLGKVLRYGANGEEVLTRLRWMRDVLGPVLAEALASSGPLDAKAYVSQMLQSGDEGHNRNRTGTLLFLRDIMPHLFSQDRPQEDLAEVVRFLGANDYFALNIVMPTCKLACAAAKDVPGSSLVVTMARNGTEFGIQLSGTGDAWFTGPAQLPEGLFLGSFGPEDANPDIGDSAITETAGIGGFAMAAAPAIVRLVGADVAFAIETTQKMYEITLGEHPSHQIPILEFRGVPTGIDAAAVARTGVLPQINTGMAGRVAGVGQVGAGLVHPPEQAFTTALEALAEAAESPATMG